MVQSDLLSRLHPIGTIYQVIRVRDRRLNMMTHTAARRFDAFIFILHGSGQIRFDSGEEIRFHKGDLLYLPRNAAYSFCPTTADYEPIFCNFEFAEPTVRRYHLCTPKDTAETERLFRCLQEVLRTEPSALCESMALLYRIYGQFFPDGQESYLPSSAAGKVAAAQEYMRSHCDDAAFSISSLAQKAGVSEVYFRKLFHAQYGMPPARLLMNLRLERAKELLREPFLSLEECARQSGFSSLSYFCRVFRQEVGITPAKYRKQA